MYESNRPTKEKERFFSFMERHKRQGVVSKPVISGYMEQKHLRPVYTGSVRIASRGYGEKSSLRHFDVINQRGTTIAEIGLKNKKSPRAVWWSIN